MMMKLKNVFMLVFAGLAFTACSNDNALPDGGGSGTGAEEVWLSLSVSLPASTRDLNDDPDENATTEESQIKTLTAVFFTGFDESSTVTNVINLLSHTEKNGTVAKSAFKLSANAKSLLVIANAPAGFSPQIGQTFATVNAVRTETSDAIIGTNGFMMTNAKGGLEPSLANGTGKPLQTQSSETEALKVENVVTVKLDRVVSKVRLYADENPLSDRAAKISNVKWILNVTNLKYYPVSKRTKTQYELDNTTYKIWSDQYGLGSYRVDPNYNNSGLNFGEGDYGSNYEYYTESNAPGWKSPTNADDPGKDQTETGNAKANSLYCHENTQITNDNVHGYTTHALVKAYYMPTEYGLPDGTTTDIQEPGVGSDIGKEDWIMINNGFYTYATLMKWMEKELTTYYAEAGHSKYLTDVFNNYLNVLSGITEVELPDRITILPENVTSTVTGLINAFNDKKQSVLEHSDKAGKYGDLTYYTDKGLCYYKIPIKHNSIDNKNNELGEYGCVRNSVYDIHISRFNNPGYPKIPDPDDTPNESDSYLAVQIEVNSWTWHKQTEIL